MASRQLLVSLGVAVLSLLVYSSCYLLDEQSRRFHRFYGDIKKGMAVVKVEQLFHESYPTADEDGWPVIGKHEGVYWFTLDPRSGRFNAELIHVVFEGGKVVSKEYLPD